MERKQLLLVVVFVVAVAGAMWLRNYFSPGPVVRRQLKATAAAIEGEQIFGVMSRISRGYGDAWGGSYESLGGHIQSVIETYDGLDVDLGISDIAVRDDQVRVNLSFVLSGSYEGQRGAILGTSMDPCRATLLWKKEQPGWRLSETEELDIPEYREELQRRRVP